MTPHDDIGAIRRLDELAERARTGRPRLFALYGHRGGRDILGWGMDFPGRDDALGDVRLTWFD